MDRLRAALKRGEPIIAAGAGTGISAKFIEKGGRGPDHYLQFGAIPDGRARFDGGADGVRGCERDRHGNR